ncbi:MAG TPA: hypothetical protein V6C57_10935 [Coleofasciculaceae cyanobacterium]
MLNYADFIGRKALRFEPRGFDVSLDELSANQWSDRHQYQPPIIQKLLKLGCGGLFSNYGTGKTMILLKWAEQVAKHTEQQVIILCPLAVASQTIKEADQKLGLKVDFIESQLLANSSTAPIAITNYDKLKGLNCDRYSGFVADESSAFKNYSGKLKQLMQSKFADTTFRLVCSATPSPNDLLELGNQSEILGVLNSHQMIARYFINDTMAAGKYKLRPFAANDFWDWVTSWAMFLTKPSDLGFSDEGWDIPKPTIHRHCVEVDHTIAWNETDRDGQISLFRTPSLNATSIHKEQRLNVDAIASKVAEIAESVPRHEPLIVWCFTDYESEAIAQLIPDSFELRGSETAKAKTAKLEAFSDGRILRLITKPEIAGLGLNWQHCGHQIFVMGTSYSFEQYHQALHRTVRFGQTRSVQTHVVYAETAGDVVGTIERKERQHEHMQFQMIRAVKRSIQHQKPSDYNPKTPMIIPSWLKAKAAQYAN